LRRAVSRTLTRIIRSYRRPLLHWAARDVGLFIEFARLTSARLPADQFDEMLLLMTVVNRLRPDDLFLDVGAHDGEYVLASLDRLGPKGRVEAFEPTPATFANLQMAVSGHTSSAAEVRLHQVAVAAGPGTTPFVTTGTSRMNSIFQGKSAGLDRPGGPERVIEVRMVRLDDYVDESRRIVAKIDVEGAEVDVLRGAPKLLASDADIFVELHPWAWEPGGWAALLSIVQASARRIVRLDGRQLESPAHCRTQLVKL
jgi:FkbM family methyltransferase